MKQANKYKQGQLVKVFWVDSNFSKGWFPANTPTADIPPIKTIGWVSANSPMLLEICSTVGLDGTKLNPLSIPWGAIIKVDKL